MDVGRGAEYDSHSRRVWDDSQAGDERRRYRDQPEYDAHSSRYVAHAHYTVCIEFSVCICMVPACSLFIYSFQLFGKGNCAFHTTLHILTNNRLLCNPQIIIVCFMVKFVIIILSILTSRKRHGEMETAGSGAKRFDPAYMEVEGDYHRSHFETGARRDGRPREYEERGAGSSGRQEDWDRWPREQIGRDGQRLPYDDRRREPLKSDYGWKSSRDDERVCVCVVTFVIPVL